MSLTPATGLWSIKTQGYLSSPEMGRSVPSNSRKIEGSECGVGVKGSETLLVCEFLS